MDLMSRVRFPDRGMYQDPTTWRTLKTMTATRPGGQGARLTQCPSCVYSRQLSFLPTIMGRIESQEMFVLASIRPNNNSLQKPPSSKGQLAKLISNQFSHTMSTQSKPIWSFYAFFPFLICSSTCERIEAHFKCLLLRLRSLQSNDFPFNSL